MTIERGEAWGRPGVLPDDAPIAGSNGELRALIEAGRALRTPLDVVGLTGGDLWRTCGAPLGGESRLRSEALVAPVDLLEIGLDGIPNWCAAHMVARRRWMRGPIVAAMNAEFLDTWDVAPRGHPNDGRADVVEVDGMGVIQRYRAWKRLPHGTHIPHPSISVRRLRTASFSFDEPIPVELDGDPVGEASSIEVTVHPDALTVVV